MNRTLTQALREHLGKKLILLSGPRQVGKTTLAKALEPSTAYYNYDIRKDLTVFREQNWDRTKKLVVFDELHRMKKWKLWLKGLYDEGALEKQAILVTGSARLDVAKKMGDSLAGRFFSYRLHPFDLKETRSLGTDEENYARLLRVGGFPEPFLEGTDRFYGLWAQSHLDLIIRQDLISAEAIRDIDGIETLVEMLASRVGHTVSYNSLREDLGRDDKTVKRWIEALEDLFVVFRLPPYSKNITRGLKKASKFYFYDLARVQGDESAKLENLVALALKKELEYQQDVSGKSCRLYFAQNKQGQEMDFLIERDRSIRHLIEVKLSDARPAAHFSFFAKAFPAASKTQLVRHLSRESSTRDGVSVRAALPFLGGLEIP